MNAEQIAELLEDHQVRPVWMAKDRRKGLRSRCQTCGFVTEDSNYLHRATFAHQADVLAAEIEKRDAREGVA